MKITAEKNNEIITKTKVLNEVQTKLKKEFIGIDTVIDDLINSIKPYYFFSEFLKRPLVINIWGLTGTGKTSIVNRLCDLLGLTEKHFKFDCGEYVGSNYALKSEINEKISKLTEKNIIMTFDEFQLCRTINAKGEELDRMGLRPLWELIDSGIFFAYRDYNFEIIRIYKTFFSLKEVGIEIDNGIVVGEVDAYETISTKGYKTFAGDTTPDGKPYLMKICWLKTLIDQNPKYFKDLNSGDLEKFLATNEEEIHTKEAEVLKSVRAYFEDKEIGELLAIVRDYFVKHVEAPKLIDLSQSLIFCIGNLDEAYVMTHTINPDSDADLFHQHSLKITVPKIKKALSTRFRMEQISRLGNNHIIYPSFSKIDYINIIKLYLNQRVNLFKNEYSLDLKFTQALENIIYKESVYPTQGIRPVLSTLSNMVDSYISRIISDMLIASSNVVSLDKIVWDYNSKKCQYEIAIYSDTNLVLLQKYRVNLTIEKLRLSDHSETQTYTAVHEAGHAIVLIYDYGLIPKEIRSKSASGDAYGFCTIDFPEIITKHSLIKEIKMLYGGIEAERLIFGDDFISTGAGSDLTKATNLIIRYFKEYGMNDMYMKVSSVVDADQMGNRLLFDDAFEEKAKDMAIKLREETAQILKTHKNELVTLSNVLARKSKVTTKDITKILDLSKVDIRTKENFYEFKKKLGETKQNAHTLKFLNGG